MGEVDPAPRIWRYALYGTGNLKYTDLMKDGKARMFTWVMEAKSVVTSPSPEKPLIEQGVHQLRGLAWSGRGKIARVDVSLDGGRNWRTAELHGPVLNKCLTRFTMPIEWNGESYWCSHGQWMRLAMYSRQLMRSRRSAA